MVDISNLKAGDTIVVHLTVDDPPMSSTGRVICRDIVKNTGFQVVDATVRNAIDPELIQSVLLKPVEIEPGLKFYSAGTVKGAVKYLREVAYPASIRSHWCWSPEHRQYIEWADYDIQEQIKKYGTC